MFEAGDDLIVTNAWCSTLKDGDTAHVMTTRLNGRRGQIRWTSGYHAGQVMGLTLEGYFKKVERLGPW